MNPKMETALCANCRAQFQRRAGRSKPRLYCDKPRCQKVSKLKNSVAKFRDLPHGYTDTGSRTAYSEIQNYNGGYSE